MNASSSASIIGRCYVPVGADSVQQTAKMNRYLVMMVVGAVLMLAGVGWSAFTLVVETEEGANIGGGFIAVGGLVLLATGGALRGD